MQAWELVLWGAPRLRRDGREIALGTVDAPWLAYLALEGPVPSRTLALLVWPERDAAGALNNLHQRIYKLRRRSGARLVEVGALTSLAADLRWAGAGAVADDAPRLLGPQEFEQAELAAWLQAQRQRLHAERRSRLEAQAAAAESHGDFAGALTLAARLLESDRLSEAAHRRVMRLHYLAGDAPAALRAFQACREALRELDVPLAQETLQLRALAERGLLWPAAAPALPLALLRPPVTIGRDDARSALHAALAAGLTPLLLGEAGLGKSRLVAELVAAAGATTLVVQARPGDAAAPYLLLQRLLAALASWQVTAAPVPADPRPAARQALCQAARGGLAWLAVDDLHFADVATLEWLRDEVTHTSPVRWVLATRPPAVAECGTGALSNLQDVASVSTITLEPLSAAEVEAFLDSLELADLVPRELRSKLQRHTGGNPLYLLETLRVVLSEPRGAGAALPAPQGVAQLIQRRLSRLSPSALALTRVAALAAPDFSAELAAHVLEAPVLALADAWAELEAAHVLRGEAFAHDLVLEAARRITPAPVARHTHGRIAGFLAGRGGGDAVRMAVHWERAGMPDEASAGFERAAAEADRQGRLRESAELLRQAALQAQCAGAGDRAGLLGLRAVGRSIQSAGPAAAVDDLAWLAAHADSAERRAQAELARAVVRLWEGRNADADEAAAAALALHPSTRIACQAVRVRAMSLRQRGRAAEALLLLQPWAAAAEGLEDAEERSSFLSDHASLLLSVERIGEADTAVERALAHTLGGGDAQAHATALINRFVCSVALGDLERALAAGAEADHLLAADGQSRVLRAMNRLQWGFVLGATGRYGEGLAMLEDAAGEAGEALPGWIGAVASNARGRLLLQMGQRARALRLLGLDPPQVTPLTQITRLVLLAELQGLATPAGRALLARAQEEAARAAHVGQGILVELLMLEERDPDDRLRRLPALERQAADAGYRWMQGQATLGRLEALLATGQSSAAAAEAEAAAQALQVYRHPCPYHPRTLLRAATLASACGRGDLGAGLLRLGIEWVQAAELHVPEPFTESFRHRNPVNVALRAAWRVQIPRGGAAPRSR